MPSLLFSDGFIVALLLLGLMGGGVFFIYAAHQVSYSEADDQADMQEQADYYARGGK